MIAYFALNDAFVQAGDGTTTATILSAAFVAEGMKIVAAGANPVQLTRGMDKTIKHLVKELKELSKDVEDSELASVAAVSAGGNNEVCAIALNLVVALRKCVLANTTSRWRNFECWFPALQGHLPVFSYQCVEYSGREDVCAKHDVWHCIWNSVALCHANVDHAYVQYLQWYQCLQCTSLRMGSLGHSTILVFRALMPRAVYSLGLDNLIHVEPLDNLLSVN